MKHGVYIQLSLATGM